jgi:hypothetical protein
MQGPVKYILTIFSLLCSIFLNAQTVLISDDVNVRSEDVYEIVGEIDQRIFVFLEKQYKTEMLVFDDQLRFIRTNEWEFEKKKVNTVGVNHNRNHINYIYSYREKGNTIVKVRQYNSQLELISNDTIKFIPKTVFPIQFYYTESEDRSKALIFSTDKNKEISAYCYDLNTRSSLWEKTFEFSQNLREDFREVLLTNSGVAYLILDSSPISFKKDKLKIDIIRFSRGMDLPVSFFIEINDLKSIDALFAYDNKNGFLVSCGLYTDKHLSRTNGYYMIRVNALNPENRFFHKQAFRPEVEREIISDAKDKKAGVLDLRAVDFILREDGGILLFNEIVKSYTRYGGLNQSAARSMRDRSWIDYYHEDIVLTSIHPDGKHHWSKVLHKKQYSQDDDGIFSSFFLFKNKSAIHLFYNDEISLSNTVSEYIVTSEGLFDRKSVMSTEYQKLRLRFIDARQLNGRSLIIPSNNASKLNLVKVVF